MWKVFTAVSCALTIAVMASSYAQQPPASTAIPDQLSIEQRIGQELGPLMVRSAVLAQRVEQLQAQLATANNRIGELERQLADAKAGKPK